MKKHRAIIFIVIMFVITGIMTLLHFKSREEIPENAIEIIYEEETYMIDITELDYKEVSGIRVNGKGEEIEVRALGIALKAVLDEAKITEYDMVSVVADDAYSAQITAEEIQDGLESYLIQEDGEERLRLVVFGDKDSKRSVNNVVRIIVE